MTATEKLQSRLNAKIRGVSGFLPSWAEFLIEVFAELLERCRNPTPNSVRSNRLRGKMASRIRRKSRRNDEDDVEPIGYAESFELADAYLDVARGAKDKEVKAFFAECGR